MVPPFAPYVAAVVAAPPVDAVVLVVQGDATCAGAFIDAAGTVATAYHCVAAGGRPTVETVDGRRAVGVVIAASPGDDLAVLRVDALAGGPWLPVREAPPTAGEPVTAIGHPYGTRPPAGFLHATLRWSVSDGVVSAVGTYAVQITAPVNPGNSGGPVVDAEGALIGVVSRRLGGDGLGFAARGDRLAALLAAPRGPSVVGGTLGAELFASSWAGDGGTVALGARVEAAARDRVVLAASVAFPLQARWDAVRFGEVAWVGAELTAGARQRLFRGPWTSRLDAYGGVAVVERLAGEADLSLRPSSELAPIGGGRLSVGTFGLDVAAASTRHGVEWRGAMVFRWPGTVWVW